MRTKTDIITEVLVRNNRTTTDGFITDSTLSNWYVEANSWGNSFKKWPFTEGRISTTYTSTEEWNFEGYKADSIRFLTIGQKLYQKITFKDYQQMLDENPDSTDKVYTDYGRTIFINTNSGGSGTLVAYGQYQPYIDITDESGITVFTDWDEEGNEAIVEKMTSSLKRREHLPDEAELHDQRASAKLMEVWQRIMDEQSNYQIKNSEGMFKYFDVLTGGSDELNTNQF
jgi:hypothetical protein